MLKTNVRVRWEQYLKHVHVCLE